MRFASFLPGPRFVALAALLLAGCQAFETSESGLGFGTGGGTGVGTTASGGHGAIDIRSGGDTGFADPPRLCRLGESGYLPPPMFTEDVVDFWRPRARVLYSWTNEENEAALRAGGPLLAKGEDPVLGRGVAMEMLHLFTSTEAMTPEALAAKALTSVYEKVRYAWSNPWATRLGWPGETYGDRLLRIELLPEAWIAVFDEGFGIVRAHDLDGVDVPLASVLAEPERVGAIYFERTTTGCSLGTFSITGSGAYREFILGSPTMIGAFELGTEAVSARVATDVARLEGYLDHVRAYGPGYFSGEAFDSALFCEWKSTCDPYILSLSLASPLYQPTPANLVTLIETLAAFEGGAPFTREGN